MFHFNIEEVNGSVIVIFDGDLDIEATEVFEEDLMNKLLNTSGLVEFDFRNINFVDSSGIGLLITLITVLKDSNRKPRITNLNEDVKLVFELLQLEEILGQDVVIV